MLPGISSRQLQVCGPWPFPLRRSAGDLRYYAWRRSLAGVTQGPLPFFWGVSKTV
jgi:hypothetical protein